MPDDSPNLAEQSVPTASRQRPSSMSTAPSDSITVEDSIDAISFLLKEMEADEIPTQQDSSLPTPPLPTLLSSSVIAFLFIAIITAPILLETRRSN
jgi:hypothetical protein